MERGKGLGGVDDEDDADDGLCPRVRMKGDGEEDW